MRQRGSILIPFLVSVFVAAPVLARAEGTARGGVWTIVATQNTAVAPRR